MSELTAEDPTVKPAPEPAAPAPAPEAPAAEEARPDKPPEGYVPHQALHQERMTRRRLERDLAEERMKWEKANARLDEINRRFSQATTPAAPDPEADPVGSLHYEQKQTREELRQIREETQAERAKRTAEEQERAFIGGFQQQAQAFAAKTPDVQDAINYFFGDFQETLIESGYDESTATDLAKRYWYDVVARSKQDGVNPAERLYNLAKRRGYKPKAADDKIERIAAGQAAAKSITPTGGASVPNPTLDSLLKMDDDEFRNIDEKKWRKMMGG